MTSSASTIRRRIALQLAAAAVLAVGLGAASFLPPAPPKTRVEVGSLVAPVLADKANTMALVMVTTGEESYHIVKDPDGWVMPEKGRYPVRADRIEALARSLSAMRYTRPMTRDERKFDRIGLGDPLADGSGALLEVGDGRGETFVKLIVGYRDGRTYVREPGDLQAWAVDTGDVDAMPPLQRGARWLELDLVDLRADAIREVEVHPAQGSSYRLLSLEADGSRFGLAPPYDQRRVLAELAPTLTAVALSRFAPSDVMAVDEGASATQAGLHVTRTKSGLEITTTAWRRDERDYVTLAAKSLAGAAPEAAAQADAINARAGGWLFAMTDADWAAYVTPLANLVGDAASVGPRR